MPPKFIDQTPVAGKSLNSIIPDAIEQVGCVIAFLESGMLAFLVVHL